MYTHTRQLLPSFYYCTFTWRLLTVMLSDFALIGIFFLEDLWESSSNLFRDASQQQSAETWAAEEQSQALSHRVLGGDMEGVEALLHFFVVANQSFWMFLSNILDCAQIRELLCLFWDFFQGGNRTRAQTNPCSGSGSSASIDAVSSSHEQSCLDDLLSASNSPLR